MHSVVLSPRVRELLFDWMSRDEPSRSGRRGRPFDWHFTAVYPIVMHELLTDSPGLRERAAARLIADAVLTEWAARHPDQKQALNLPERPQLAGRIRTAYRRSF
jgi:hypothetical protein